MILYRGSPLCGAQGPCGRLQNKTIHDQGIESEPTAHQWHHRIRQVHSFRHHISGGSQSRAFWIFDGLVASESREILASKVENLHPLDKFWSGTLGLFDQKLRALMRDRPVHLE
jgi:hypothetical protein